MILKKKEKKGNLTIF